MLRHNKNILKQRVSRVISMYVNANNLRVVLAAPKRQSLHNFETIIGDVMNEATKRFSMASLYRTVNREQPPIYTNQTSKCPQCKNEFKKP